jgi:nuclease-like protein
MMALHHDHEHHDQPPPAWPDDDLCCPDEPGVRVRAITFDELEAYLAQLAYPSEPASMLGPRPDRSGRRHQWDAGFLDSHGRPGASAMAQYRRRRATDWRTWRATLPQRLAGVLAAAIVAALATTIVAGAGLARFTGPVAAIVLGWLLRFRPSPATLAWRHGAEGERRTARLLAPLERRGYQVFHDLAVPGSAANVDHLVVGPTGVYVIDSKRYRGRLRYTGGHLWHGGRILDRTLATLWWEATQVAEALGFGPDLHVYPVLCLHVARLPWRRELLVDGIPILGAGALRPAHPRQRR